MMLFGATVFGGFSTLLFQKVFFREKPKEIPIIIKVKNEAQAIGEMAPKEIERRILIDRCSDLYNYVCTMPASSDPTGVVYREAEGEVEVLRIYEKILAEKGKITKKAADEILVERVYDAEHVQRIKKLFNLVRDSMLSFVDMQSFRALTLEDKDLLKKRITQVELEVPPPVSVYDDDPGLITRNDVYYLRTSDEKSRIRIGGAMLFTVQSEYNLAFTLAHELAHSIDPCELREAKIDILSYKELNACFGVSETDLTAECKPEGKISEIFSDWMATHIVVDILNRRFRELSNDQLRTAIYNSVRDLCSFEPEGSSSTIAKTENDHNEKNSSEKNNYILSSDHPSPSFRVNHIFSMHPTIRKYLGCKEYQGPLLPSATQYCFWTSNHPQPK